MNLTSTDLNSMAAIALRVQSGKITWPHALAMLAARLALFALFQMLAAGLFALTGQPDAWETGIGWWPVTVTLANLATLWLIWRALRAEGLGYFDVVRLERASLWRDLLVVVALLLPLGPLGFLPNQWLGTALFGNPQTPFEMMIRPLPMAAAVLGAVAFPLTQGLVELVTYFGYVMPRLEALGGRRWLAVGLASLFLSLQHTTIPLIFDGRYLIWRALMFLPFALALGLILHWRPRLLPYLMVIHALIDTSLSFYIIAAGV